MFRFLMAALLFIGPVWARGGETTFTSGSSRVALLELFTSEGCSSCPPAERWLAQRRTDPRLWRSFVPVSWHVDYWDQLGWRDRFARPDFTAREYAYASAWHSHSVYTPCFVRDGREWRIDEPAPAVGTPVGSLTLHYDGRVVRAEFAATDREHAGKLPADLELHVVLLGGGIQSKVRGGENAGTTLAHEFVALKLVSGALGRPIEFPRSAVPGVTRYAIAAWISPPGGGEPIQVTGGWLSE